MYQSKQQKLRAKKRRRFIFFVVSALALLALAAAAIFLFLLPGSKAAPVALAMPAGSLRAYTGSGFLYVRGGSLNYSDFHDPNKDWSMGLSTEDVRLHASSAASAVYNDAAVQFIDTATGNQLFKREYSGAIELVRCGTGCVGVLRRDDEQNRQLYIMGLDDVDADELSFGPDQEVLDFGFFGQDETLWTLTLNTGGVSPNCTLETYAVAKAAKTGMMMIEGQLVERVEFVDKYTYIVGTNHILSFNEMGQEKEADRTLIYGWEFVDFGMVGGKPSFIVAPRTAEGSGTAKLITLPGQDTQPVQEALLQKPDNTRGIFIANGKYVVVTNAAVMYYSDKGEKQSEQALEILVDAAEKLSPTQLLLTRGTEQFLLEIG